MLVEDAMSTSCKFKIGQTVTHAELINELQL